MRYPVLEQANPDTILSSSKSDEVFIDALREYSMFLIFALRI